jgi:hypothetical protein
MSTPILDITEVADGQIDQFAVYNQALRDLEAASNAQVSLDLSGGDYSLSAAEFTRNFVFITTGNAVSRTLSVPPTIRTFVVRNTGSATLIVSVGSTTINIATAKSRMFYTDGTANGIVALDFT